MSNHSLPPSPSQWPVPPLWTIATAVVVLVLLWLMGKLIARRWGLTGAELAGYLTTVTCVWALVLLVGYWLWIKERP